MRGHDVTDVNIKWILRPLYLDVTPWDQRWGFTLVGTPGHLLTSKKVLKGSYATQPFLLTFAPDLKNTLCK